MSTEKKLTAVEWLVEHFDEYGIDYGFFQPIIKQAKEKEKQQIIDAGENALQTDFYVEYESVEDYYEQTFKKLIK